MKKNCLKSVGLTLVEMIVVISILAILGSFTFASYRAYQRRNNLKIAAQEIRSALVEAQNLSLSPTKEPTAPKGYGVYFDIDTPNSYQLFKDTNGNNFKDSGEEIKTYDLGMYKVGLEKFEGVTSGTKKVSVVYTVPLNIDYAPYKREVY